MTTRQRITFGLLVGSGIGTLGAFLMWWFQPNHLPHNFAGAGHIIDGLLFGLLTLVILHRPFMDVFTWIVSWTIDRVEQAPAPPEGMRVAFITTFVPKSEPIELLYRTLPAMVGADYPHDTWVLDEGGDPEVERVCRELGARYFSRAGVRRYNLIVGPYTAKTKGGNHNAWYDSHGRSYDVVAQIDTDFLPRHDFLTRTLGFFRDPKVGWVGTPQVYGNGSDSIVAKGAAQQLFMFYGAIMRGLSGRKSANMIGANHVVRVEALQQIDFYAGHLTEDLLTGMQLHAEGWTSRYVSTPLAIGEGPVTWQAFFAQQMRWAHGCMDILFHHSPGLFRKMGRRQAAIYGALQQHYFGGIAMAMGVGLLVTYFFAGLHAANVTILGVVLWAGPQFVVRQAILFWLQRFSPSPETDRGLHIAGRLVSILVWPIYFLAAVGVFRGKRLGFKVTPKGNLQDVRWIPPSVARAHLVIGLISAACIGAGFLFDRMSIPLLAWAALNAVSMLGFVAYIAINNAVLRIKTARSTPRRSGMRVFPPHKSAAVLRPIPDLVAEHRLVEVGATSGTTAEARVTT